MVGLPNPLAMFQHHKETKGPKPPKAHKQSKTGGDEDDDAEEETELMPEVASKFSSSCEIFNVFKVLAAGKRNQHSLAEDVDSDESEGEGESEPRTSEGSLRHVGSTRTVRAGDALHDDDHDDEDDHATVVGVPEMDKDETLRQWQDSFGSSTAELDAQGSRLAALQIGNLRPGRPPTIRSMSSYRTARSGSDSDSEDDHPELGRSGRPAQPTLPALRTKDLGPPIQEVQEELVTSEEPTTSSSATSSGSNSSPATPYEHDLAEKDRWEGTREKEMSETRKLQVIIEEFGEMSTLMETLDGKPAESERIIAESHGSLYRGVMTIGNLHLTTHRLLFHAMLPPDTALANGVSESGESSNQHHSILHSGPVTVHRPGMLPPVRRWFELTADMVTSYPRADEAGRIRPLRCVLLSNVRRMEPFDPEHPTDFHMVYETPSGVQKTHLSVDTEQSAMQWRRAFEGALFRFAAMQWKTKHNQRLGIEPTQEDKEKWTMVRACVPLDRVTISGVQDYHSFVTLLGLEIDLDDVGTVDFDPSNEVDEQDPVERQLHHEIDGGRSHQESHHGEMLPHQRPSRPHVEPVKRSFSLRRTDSPTTISSPASADTGSDLARRSTKKAGDATSSTPTSSPGIDTPTKKFSLRNTIERAFTPSHSRDPSPTRKPSAPKWIDTTVPGPLAKATKLSVHDSADPDAPPEVEAEYSFNIAVHTEQSWFVHSFEEAVETAKQRRYKPGVKRPKMVFNVAGHNCLITDEELDHPIERHVSVSSEDDEGEEHDTPPLEADRTQKTIKATRKAEKTSMAAKVFGLDEADGIWLKRCFVVQGVLPLRGHLIVSPRFLCFWRRATFGNDLKYRFKTNDVKQVVESASMQIGYHGLALKIAGHHDLRLEFRFKTARTEAMSHIQTMIDTASANNSPSLQSLDSPSTPSDRPPSIHSTLSAPVKDDAEYLDSNHPADVLAPPKEALYKTRAWPDEALSYMPFVANKPRESATRLSPRTFAMLTIGSRGDVQPYIALALRLKKDGHKVVIITHDEFKTWVEGYGIIHRQAGGDPTALMKLSQEHAMFSPGFFKESLGSFRQWLDDLLLDAWTASHDADVLIESPSAMAGVHIAEARHIPYFRAFTMPWTRTSAYPQAFMVPAFEMGPSFNYSTYVLFDNIIWAATSGQINRWRKDHLGLKSTDMSSLSITKVPFLYNFSSAVVPKPLDWRDDITITGYWNLDDSDTDWTPPKGLDEFMKKARDDAKPLVYIGFGSIVVPRPNAMTKSIIKAVEKAGVRAIIAKGWSSRGGDPAKEGTDIQFPDSCFSLEKVPHGWLFPRIDAALHHGGAGTVGASLRAGIPTLIKPWFGDQYFWANRVTKLEVGLKVPSLRSDEIAHCLIKATSSTLMIEKAKRVGQLIRSEHGVDNAVAAIQFNIIRAAADRRKMSYQK